MSLHKASTLNLSTIFRAYPWALTATWLLVFLENILTALIPYGLGLTIDQLLAGNTQTLWLLGAALLLLTLIAVLRRFYDTRVYGRIRVDLSEVITQRGEHRAVSRINAHLGMSRELTDFYEETIPQLFSAIIQILVAVVILASFGYALLLSTLGVVIAMALIYAGFHRTILRLNSQYNTQTERQVQLLTLGDLGTLSQHFNRLRRQEIKLSDVDALLYGSIFTGMIAFLLFNLWYGANIEGITAGRIFTLLSYSWEFISAAFIAPLTLQALTRLHDIVERINAPDKVHAPEKTS